MRVEVTTLSNKLNIINELKIKQCVIEGDSKIITFKTNKFGGERLVGNTCPTED